MGLKWIWLAIGGLFGVVLVVSNKVDAPAPVAAPAVPSHAKVAAPVRATSKAAGFQPAIAAQAGATAAPNFSLELMGAFPTYWLDTAPQTGASSTPAYGSVQIGDVTGDGWPDVVATYGGGYVTYGHSTVIVFAGWGDGTFAKPAFYPLPDIQTTGHMLLGDFNEDGAQDIVLAGQYRIGLLASKPGGFDFATRAVSDTVQMSSLVPPGILDVDGDGHLDLVFVLQRAGQAALENLSRIQVHYGDGHGSFPRTWSTVTFGTDRYDEESMSDLRVGDIDNDGVKEIVYRSEQFDYWKQSRAYKLRFFKRDGAGHLAPMMDVPALIPTPSGTYSQINQFTLGDFNGDGRLDIAGVPYDQTVWIKLQSPNGQFDTAPLARTTQPIPVPMIAADLDNSGADDLVIGHSGWSRISWYLQSNGQLGEQTVRNSGGQDSSVGLTGMAVGDVTGDNCKDVAFSQGYYGLMIFRGMGCKPRVPRIACCSGPEQQPTRTTAGAPAVPAQRWMWSTQKGGWVQR